MNTPPNHQSITWVYTLDLDGTARFYAETLGLELVLDQGLCRIYRWSATSFIGVCFARPGRFVEPKGVVLSFITPDVDGWYAHFIAKGVSPEGEPQESAQFGVYCFFVKDPNGYLLEFQTFRNPAWPALKTS